MSVTPKTVVFDIAESWGGGQIGVRRIDFKLLGVSLGLTSSDYTAYATSYIATNFIPANAFDTSLLLTGGAYQNAWLTSSSASVRLIIVFNTEQEFDEIEIQNYHNSGSATLYGSKNVVTTISPDTIIDTTYGATISNPTVLNSIAWPEHSEVDEADPYTSYPLLPNIDSIVGSLVLSGTVGMTHEYPPISVAGGLVLSGSVSVATPNNTIVGALVLSGGVSMSSNQPVSIVGGLVLSGSMDTIRVNKDVTITGSLCLRGNISLSSDGSDCSLPSFDDSRWC